MKSLIEFLSTIPSINNKKALNSRDLTFKTNSLILTSEFKSSLNFDLMYSKFTSIFEYIL